MFSLSAQDFLELKEIREGVVILKNKGLRIILMVSSLNFALKSQEEQEATIYQFQNFLNSLDFSCQILVQSKKLNITGYLEKISEREKKEKSELIQLQIKEYRNFISQIVKEGDIMHKNFFVIVPFSLSEPKSIISSSSMTDEDFQRARNQLLQRVRFIMLGLRSCGLTSRPLNSLELAEFYWSHYHPTESEKGFYPDFPPDLVK
ncbi:MAG: hypothetical protein PHH17_01445 [Candidatus Pacebacteria bacterium]|jgi:hypothetical protein|nr:hypothetical protein [Candidatus Paceibacterota bacterium]MDD3072576.1 hypothetical protein [Candidatus Paceibacterota bacterium]MDD3729161.1 hypothetical protein [Candidatus Paceibacterota bacterium]MDD4201727.1 hypothetical protein [Candidatus Paceibacterota bacterium]MDD4467232.1 hypothetical protein [Candidatus Paceibacterota bacterium]